MSVETETDFQLTEKKELLKRVLESELKEYLEQLENIDKIILITAETQLGTSFDISKSIGFLDWKKNK